MSDVYLCPNCGDPIIIDKLRCGEFIHAYLKKTLKPVNPHISDVDLIRLIQKKKIVGCGYKFTIAL